MKILTVLLALEAVASAQPAVDPAPPDEPVAPPAEPTPPLAPPSLATPSTGHDMAVRMTTVARNAAARGKCALIDSLAKRVYELDATYYDQVFAIDTTIARCRAAARPPGLVAVAEPSARHSGFTAEAGIGAAMLTDGHDTLFGVGPGFGLGGFISPTLALSVRLSGSIFTGDGAVVFLGVLGPNVQLWLNDNVWIGGGAGLGVAVGCAEGCGGVTGFGLDARLGYAFQPRGQRGANLSIETTYESFGGTDVHLPTVSFMLGYQSF